LGLVGFYAKRLITTKIDIAKYGFENEKVERIIENAIDYAEHRAKQAVKEKSIKLASSDKLAGAKRYINTIDKSIIEKYGLELDSMIARKIEQSFKKK
jgi:isocitrate/isopropylmalate dehydrogenase